MSLLVNKKGEMSGVLQWIIWIAILAAAIFYIIKIVSKLG